MMPSPSSLATKVAFLRGLCGHGDEVIETHFAWIFLTGDRALKLRKPQRRGTMDYGSLEARRRGSLEELRLNRPLAPGVYLDALPLTADTDGRLALGGTGRPVDWLVRMRRLDRAQFLDARLARLEAGDRRLGEIARWLADFYRRAETAPVDGPAFVARLHGQVAANHRVLQQADIPGANALTGRQDDFIAAESALFAQRAAAGCVVEAHGDLRPEHVFLGSPPAIIDRLEFDRELRLLDRAEELSLLELECARLGHADVGRRLRGDCLAALGDGAAETLLAFYRSHRATTRAKLYVWRSAEPDGNTPAAWIERAKSYVSGALAEFARTDG